MENFDREPAPRLAAVSGQEPNEGGNDLFAELAMPELDSLYRFACRLERDRDRAWDLLQTALLVGMRKFEQLESSTSFRPWMSRILYRQFLNSRRRRTEEPLEDVEPTSSAWTSQPALDPQERFLARRRGRMLAAALERLPRSQRVAVLLIDVQGYTYAEAASILDVPPGTVASRVVRGRHGLRADLRSSPEFGDDDD